MTATAPISIKTDVLQCAERNARALGLSVSEYLSRLVLKDTHPARKKLEVFPVERGWGPVPKHVQERWAAEEQAAVAHGPTAHSVAEFRCQLEPHETD